MHDFSFRKEKIMFLNYTHVIKCYKIWLSASGVLILYSIYNSQAVAPEVN
jgi:hypothetical protein